jgi:creatinine amidohydrolase
MRVADMDWRMIEDWVRHDDRGVLPLGSTEQHGGLSLLTDAILAERLAAEAAEPLGIPVFPALPFGMTPYFQAFPGGMSLRVATYAALLTDLLDSMKRGGFRRIVIVNGHAGNHPALAVAQEWMMDNADCRVRVHDWMHAPKTRAMVTSVDPVGGHGGWRQNFPWTRLPGTEAEADKEMISIDRLRTLPPFEARELLEDGSYGGKSQRADADMFAIWEVAVEETRALLEEW